MPTANVSPLAWELVIVAEQLSLAVGAVQETAALQSPASLAWVMLAGMPLRAGASLSSTVTVAVAVAELPDPSKTVRVTVLSPRSSQSKLSGDTVMLAMPPQVSSEPLSIWAAVMLALPVASSCTVMSWAAAVGSTRSRTVMVAVAVLTLPLLSVTVRVTVLSPWSSQSNAVWLRDREAMPQASLDPLSTSSAVMLAAPEASSSTVKFWAMAVGATLSSTVTVAVADALLPLLSVTVRVTVLAPTLAQPKDVMSRAMVWMPQASLEPLSMSAVVMEPAPEASS